MSTTKIRRMIGSVGLALGLAGVANAQCLGDKLVDDNPGSLSFMGASVDLYNTSAVLGAPGFGQDGRVLFFERTGATQWTELDEFTSPNSIQGQEEHFGRAVAIFGNFAVVGAPMFDDGGDTDSGAIHIYRKIFIFGAPTWIFDETIENPSPDFDDQFGAAVDVTVIGTTVTVAAGAPYDDITGAAQAGRVRIYTRNNDTGNWSLQDTITASTAQADAHFGSSLAFDGQQLIVGAPDEDVSGLNEAGAAYLYFQTGTDWGTGERFVAPAANRSTGDKFGGDVAIRDHWFAVGAPGDNEGLENDAGAIYMFKRVSGVWSFQQRLLDLTVGAFDQLGAQIDMAAGVLVAGDPSDNFCHIWRVDAGGVWNMNFPFVATDPPASGSHSFGSDVALDMNGETVLVGDGSDDIGKSGGAGSGYIFTTDQNPGSDCDGGLLDPVPSLNNNDVFYGCNVGNPTDGSTSCVSNTHADGWYQFTAPCNGVLALSTCGTHDLMGEDDGIDTVLSVHTGCPGNPGNQIACNDDAPGGNYPNACGGIFGDAGNARDAALKVSVTAGQTYRVRVAGFGSSGNEGLFILHVDFTCCRVDWDGNGTVNSTDVSAFINDWFADQANGTLVTDFDGNGVSNSTDVSTFINEWFAGCGF